MKYNLKQTVSLNSNVNSCLSTKHLGQTQKNGKKQPWEMMLLKMCLSVMDGIILLACNKKCLLPVYQPDIKACKDYSSPL
jgi:hypothetical protein